MAKIKPTKDVSDYLNTIGLTLLSEYAGNYYPLDYVCRKGHIGSRSLASIQRNPFCTICSGHFTRQEDVEKEYLKYGYKLLSQYKNGYTAVSLECPKGHKFKARYDNFKLPGEKRGRCPYCIGSKNHPDFIRQEFLKHGYVLLDTYVNSQSKLKFICPNKHEHSITWNSFKDGKRCAKCAGLYKTEEEKRQTKTALRIRSQISSFAKYVFRNENWNSSKRTKFAQFVAFKIKRKFGEIPKEYEIDHIIPVSFFNLRRDKEVLACWHIENLRLISSTENKKRGNRLTEQEVKNFNAAQLKILDTASKKPKKWATYIGMLPLLQCSDKDIFIFDNVTEAVLLG